MLINEGFENLLFDTLNTLAENILSDTSILHSMV